MRAERLRRRVSKGETRGSGTHVGRLRGPPPPGKAAQGHAGGTSRPPQRLGGRTTEQERQGGLDGEPGVCPGETEARPTHPTAWTTLGNTRLSGKRRAREATRDAPPCVSRRWSRPVAAGAARRGGEGPLRPWGFLPQRRNARGPRTEADDLLQALHGRDATPPSCRFRKKKTTDAAKGHF